LYQPILSESARTWRTILINKLRDSSEMPQVHIPETSELLSSHKPSDVVVVEKPCDRATGVSNMDKWIIAAIIAIIFILLASVWAFWGSNFLFSKLGLPTVTKHGKPTLVGLVVHAIVFVIIVRLLMH